MGQGTAIRPFELILEPTNTHQKIYPGPLDRGIKILYTPTAEKGRNSPQIPRFRITESNELGSRLFQVKHFLDFELLEQENQVFELNQFDENLNRLNVGNLLSGRSSIQVKYPASPPLPWGKYARITLKSEPEIFSQDVNQTVPNEFAIQFAPQKEFWSYLIMTSDGITENKYGIYKKDTVVVGNTSSNEEKHVERSTPFYKFLVTQQGEILSVE